MATVKTIIEKAYTKVNGEYEALVEASDDFKTYLNVLNQVMETWARTPYVKWQSLFDIDYRLPDPVADGVFQYSIPDSHEIQIGNSPYDHVFLMDDGVVVDKYKIVDQAMYQNATRGKICLFSSGTLYFKDIPVEVVGSQIHLPAYVMPPTYTSGSQKVNVDSVAWLTTAMAAFICDSSPVPFIARNADKFAKQADTLMKSMKQNNKKNQHLIIKSTGAGGGRPASLSAAIDAGVGVGGINAVDGGSF